MFYRQESRRNETSAAVANRRPHPPVRPPMRDLCALVAVVASVLVQVPGRTVIVDDAAVCGVVISFVSDWWSGQ